MNKSAWWFCFACLAAAAAARGEMVRLSNGDTLNVTIVERTDAAVTFDHPVLGRVTMDASKLAVLTPEQSAAAAAQTPAPLPPAVTPAPPPRQPLELKLFGFTFMKNWQRRLEFSADGTRGNSTSSTVRVGFDGRYEDAHKRWLVESDYYRASADGDEESNKFSLDATRDWLIPGSPWFYFLKSRYDYDEFDTFRHRAAVSGGVGYQFVTEPQFDLIGRIGAGGNYAWDANEDDADDEFTPEGLLGVEGVWRIRVVYPLEFRNTLYPDLEHPGEFRNLSEVSFLIPIDAGNGLRLKLGVENEYDSITEGDSKHNDLRYFAALVFDF